MEKLKDADIKRVKALGFLINRGTSDFSGRIVPAGSIFTAKELSAVAEIADKFGNGKIAMTNRLSAEVIGIPYENIDDAIAYAKSHNLFLVELVQKSARLSPAKELLVFTAIMTRRHWQRKFMKSIILAGPM